MKIVLFFIHKTTITSHPTAWKKLRWVNEFLHLFLISCLRSFQRAFLYFFFWYLLRTIECVKFLTAILSRFVSKWVGSNRVTHNSLSSKIHDSQIRNWNYLEKVLRSTERKRVAMRVHCFAGQISPTIKIISKQENCDYNYDKRRV